MGFSSCIPCLKLSVTYTGLYSLYPHVELLSNSPCQPEKNPSVPHIVLSHGLPPSGLLTSKVSGCVTLWKQNSMRGVVPKPILT
jgi:hypothetical protein